MKTIKVTPKTIKRAVRRIGPGDTLFLEDGQYQDPVVIADIWGTRDNPVTLRGKSAVFGSDQNFEDYSRIANRLAQDLEREGKSPGLYHVADEAYLVLRNCQWIVIDNLRFEKCWPTAIYIDNCQNICLQGLVFSEGTFAIAATGERTRHLLVERCTWRQDVSRDNSLWRSIPWKRVHSNWRSYDRKLHRDKGTGHVDVARDARAYDGDFFRAWNIAGFVVFRKNRISDAFNAIHFFNSSADGPSRAFSRNVLIEKNRFERIRDNAVEPEAGAWNWIVRHNQFIDCYAPFSLEMQRSGYFYVYGNLGWCRSRPGPENDPHSLGRLFKLPGRHRADGPHYVVHNSWYVRAPIIRKKRISYFIHLNNAVEINEELDEPYNPVKTSPFGRNWRVQLPQPPATMEDQQQAERSHFTKDWLGLGIRFDGDVVNHPDFPEELRAAGYPLGAAALGAEPGFARPGRGPKGLMLKRTACAKRRALSFTVEFADGRCEEVSAETHGQDVGAWQGDKLFSLHKHPLWVMFGDD